MEEVLDENYWANIWDHHISDGRVLVPCYHPAVMQNSKGDCGLVGNAVTRDMFINPDSCCSNPYSIDAAIAVRCDMKRFIDHNKRLRHEHQNGECPVCLEPFSENDQLIYGCHVFHSECASTLSRCPLCRQQYWL